MPSATIATTSHLQCLPCHIPPLSHEYFRTNTSLTYRLPSTYHCYLRSVTDSFDANTDLITQKPSSSSLPLISSSLSSYLHGNKSPVRVLRQLRYYGDVVVIVELEAPQHRHSGHVHTGASYRGFVLTPKGKRHETDVRAPVSRHTNMYTHTPPMYYQYSFTHIHHVRTHPPIHRHIMSSLRASTHVHTTMYVLLTTSCLHTTTITIHPYTHQVTTVSSHTYIHAYVRRPLYVLLTLSTPPITITIYPHIHIRSPL